jgi:hypothetical protein
MTPTIRPIPIAPASPPRVIYLDRTGIELPIVAEPCRNVPIGYRVLRAPGQQVPAVVVRRGEL